MKPLAILLCSLPLMASATSVLLQSSPPMCFDACLVSAVSESESCQVFDTPCICADPPTISSWVNCLYYTCSDSDFPLAIDAGDALCSSSESSTPSITALPISAPPDMTPHVEVKELSLPVKRQNAADPPQCFNMCLMPAVMSTGTCQPTDTACICRDAPIYALLLNCLTQACSQTDYTRAVAAGDSLCAPFRGGVGPSVAASASGIETMTSLLMAPPITTPSTVGNGTSITGGSASGTSVAITNTSAISSASAIIATPVGLTSTAKFSAPTIVGTTSTSASASAVIPPTTPSGFTGAGARQALPPWITLAGLVVGHVVVFAI